MYGIGAFGLSEVHVVFGLGILNFGAEVSQAVLKGLAFGFFSVSRSGISVGDVAGLGQGVLGI